MGESDSSFSIVTYIFGCLILNSATAALAVVIGFFLMPVIKNTGFTVQ